MAGARPSILIDATPLRSWSGLRGIGRFIHDLLDGLARTRDEWSTSLSIQAISSLRAPGQWVITGDLAAVGEEAFASRGTAGRELLKARARLLVPAARAAGTTVLHVTEAIGLPWRIPIPWLVTCYDLVPLRYPRHYLPHPVAYGTAFVRAARTYHGADRIVAISRKSGSELQAILRVPAHRIDIVPLDIDLARWLGDRPDDAQRCARLGVGERPFVIYAGYSDFRKNVEGMLAALAHARRQVDVELVWAGKLPPKQQARIGKKADKLGVTPYVRLLGFVSDEDLTALFRRAAAHLFISRLEGFGLSVAEAQAAGCPVVVARDSGSDEVAGDAALVVDPDDPGEAGDALVRLLTDPAERQRLVDAGRKRVAASTCQRMARAYVDSYRRVVLGVQGPQDGSSRAPAES